MTNVKLVAFLATIRPEAALAFYRDVVGLTVVEDSPFALVLDCGGTMVRVQKVAEFTPQPFTALGWSTPDILASVNELRRKGAQFKRFDGLPQDEHAIWLTPTGDKVAWFSDPDGNVLSLTQFVAPSGR